MPRQFDVLKITSRITGRSEFIRLGTNELRADDPMTMTYLFQFCSVKNGMVQGYDYSDQLMDICPLGDLKGELEEMGSFVL